MYRRAGSGDAARVHKEGDGMQLPVGKTDPGRVREMNQDEFGIRELPGGAVLMVVCDGMGGATSISGQVPQ